MARKKRRKGGGGRPGGQPVKGFRPGKEPPELRKKQAREQLGGDASWAQKQAVDLVADRTPAEVRSMMNRWVTGLLVAAVILAIAGAALYGWSIAAGIVVHVLAAVAVFFWHRMRRQRDQLVSMAETLGKSGRRK